MNLLVLNYEYPPLGGGAGVVTQNIAERLALLGHKVTVVTTWFKTEKETEETGNLKIIRLKSKRKYTYKSNISEMLSWIKESRIFLQNYCRKEKFDVCFANFTIPGGIVALYLKRTFRLKYFILSHGHDVPWRFPKQMLPFHIVTYTWIKKICKESEINFVLTKEMKGNIDKFLGKRYISKNVLIPNGIDSKPFVPDYTQRSKTFKIVFIGRLVKQKAPFTFLKAIKLYVEKNKNLIVHIIGDGVLRQKMEAYVNTNGLQDVVKFLGWIAKEKIIKEYQSSHVNVISSVFEGMSIVALEALACGCFLIATPVDGIEQIITANENGVIVNFHETGEITMQLEDYYEKKYLNGYKVSDSIMNVLREHYDWDKVVMEYEKKLKNL